MNHPGAHYAGSRQTDLARNGFQTGLGQHSQFRQNRPDMGGRQGEMVDQALNAPLEQLRHLSGQGDALHNLTLAVEQLLAFLRGLGRLVHGP